MSVLVIRRRRGLHVQTTLNYLINKQDGINERVGQNFYHLLHCASRGDEKKRLLHEKLKVISSLGQKFKNQ